MGARAAARLSKRTRQRDELICCGPMQTHHLNAPSSKTEIIGFLAAQCGFKRYLELCTPTTGNYYGMLDRHLLPTTQRLMYNCPADFHDGFVVDFRTPTFDISQCVAAIRSKSLRYDIILVDPFHEYDTSLRDLREAFALINTGGILVVHDCLPPEAGLATPKFQSGSWCGVTYKAYLDFVSARRDLEYYTVNIDYGCGIIRKLDLRSRCVKSLSLLDPFRKKHAQRDQHRLLWQQWSQIGNDFERAFLFFEKHKRELLNLISAAEFSARILHPSADHTPRRDRQQDRQQYV